MGLISLKDYAAMNNVTYEAVRQQVIRYADELGDHIVKDGRQQFLDDDAVEFLDTKRQKNPVSIIQANKDEEIERLRQEKENLLVKIAAQSDRISELSEWKAENAVLIARAEQQALLLEDKTKQLETLQHDFEEKVEELREYKDMKHEQNLKISELLREKDEQERVIAAYQQKEAEEAGKSKWQRFKELWKSE